MMSIKKELSSLGLQLLQGDVATAPHLPRPLAPAARLRRDQALVAGPEVGGLGAQLAGTLALRASWVMGWGCGLGLRVGLVGESLAGWGGGEGMPAAVNRQHR